MNNNKRCSSAKTRPNKFVRPNYNVSMRVGYSDLVGGDKSLRNNSSDRYGDCYDNL